MKHVYLFLIAALISACGAKQEPEQTAQAPKRPSKTLQISRAACEDIRTNIETTDYLVLSSSDVIVLQTGKVYRFTSGALDPIQDEIITLDGFCTFTIEAGELTNIETVPVPTPAPCWGWFC